MVWNLRTWTVGPGSRDSELHYWSYTQRQSHNNGFKTFEKWAERPAESPLSLDKIRITKFFKVTGEEISPEFVGPGSRQHESP
jgi:hypothetical protein